MGPRGLTAYDGVLHFETFLCDYASVA